MKFESVVNGKLINVTQKPYNFNGNTGISTKALISVDDLGQYNCIEVKVDKNSSDKFLNATTFEEYLFTLEFDVFGKSINFKLTDLQRG